MNIQPYILIGGASKRFGTDKAMFVFEGETLAGRAARIAETALAPANAIYVAAHTGQFPAFNDRSVITDLYQARGAIGAVHAALMNARTEWIFVLACDLPFVSVDLIGLLKERIAPDVEAVVPVQPDGRWQPLCAFYKTENCRAAFENAIEGAGRLPSLRATLEPLRTRAVPYSEYGMLENAEGLLHNVNTPEDLHR